MYDDSAVIARNAAFFINPPETLLTVQEVDQDIEEVVKKYESLLSDFYEGYLSASSGEEVQDTIRKLTEMIPDLIKIKTEFENLEKIRGTSYDPDGFLEAD